MVTVTLASGRSFKSSRDMSILDAAAQENVIIPYSCKTGRCSTCKCKVVHGNTKALVTELGLSEEEKADGWILSCVRTAMTDLVIEAEDLGSFILPEAKTHPCRISSLEMLAEDVIKVVLRFPPNVVFNFIPGQYIDVIGPGGTRRSYSIANAPKADNTLELHIRAVVKGTMSHYWFNEAKVNHLLRMRGPLGTFFWRGNAQRNVIFMATGTGIAPIKAMLEEISSLAADHVPKSVTVLWGARHQCDLYFDVAGMLGVQNYLPVLSQARDDWNGQRGYVQDALLRQMPDLTNSEVYACGSNSMIQSAKSALTAVGLPAQRFFSDAFVCSSTVAQ